MKQSIFLLFLTFCINTAIAQKYKLIETKKYADNSKDCSVIGNCISSKYLKNDTLHLTIFINNNGLIRDGYYRDTLSYKHDTLNLYQVDTKSIPPEKIYNSSTKKMETYNVSRAPMMMVTCGGPDILKIQYTLTGFTKMPKVIQYEYSNLCDCPTRPIKFDVYKGDTINITNANGHKHGVWIEFYDTGEMKKKRYDNGHFIDGYFYDKAGNITHKIEEGGMEVAIPFEMVK